MERVSGYSRTLAERLKRHPKYATLVDDNYVRLVYETSPLHDIGKVAIPDSVLQKPGQLSAAEYELMKAHTLRGAETLSAAIAEFPNANFLRMARDIALCHHERYDGKGYPRGLAGDEIPLCGRIVALADVYDAPHLDPRVQAAFRPQHRKIHDRPTKVSPIRSGRRRGIPGNRARVRQDSPLS